MSGNNSKKHVCWVDQKLSGSGPKPLHTYRLIDPVGKGKKISEQKIESWTKPKPYTLQCTTKFMYGNYRLQTKLSGMLW